MKKEMLNIAVLTFGVVVILSIATCVALAIKFIFCIL